MSGEPGLITGVTVQEPAILPALRADLAPLLPALRKTATVVAAAVVADWALRVGARALLQEGLSLIVGGNGKQAQALPALNPLSSAVAPERSGTVVVEQRVVIRRS